MSTLAEENRSENLATKKELLDLIRASFLEAGCAKVMITKQTESYCLVRFVSPNGNNIVCTVWYDKFKKPTNKIRKRYRYVDWDDSIYRVNLESGEVEDKEENSVGRLSIQLNDPKEYHPYNSLFKKNSVRINTNDVSIQNILDSDSNMSDVIAKLEQRTIE